MEETDWKISLDERASCRHQHLRQVKREPEGSLGHVQRQMQRERLLVSEMKSLPCSPVGKPSKPWMPIGACIQSHDVISLHHSMPSKHRLGQNESERL